MSGCTGRCVGSHHSSGQLPVNPSAEVRSVSGGVQPGSPARSHRDETARGELSGFWLVDAEDGQVKRLPGALPDTPGQSSRDDPSVSQSGLSEQHFTGRLCWTRASG